MTNCTRLMILTFLITNFLMATSHVVAQPPPPAPNAPSINTFSLTTTAMPVQPGVVIINATYVRAPAGNNNSIEGVVFVFNMINGVKTSMQASSISGNGGPNGTLPQLQTQDLRPLRMRGVYAVFTLKDAAGNTLDTKTTPDYAIP